MSQRRRQKSGIDQQVSNRGSERGLSRQDAFTAYVMDRLLHRLGRSRHAEEFLLKGGVLVANLIDAPHRFTRDVDVLRRKGRPSPDELREMFKDIVAVPADDGITFPPSGVRAVKADHDVDGYDGVKVTLRATVGRRSVDVRVDVGFGDAVVPPASRRTLAPFLEADEPASVFAYHAEVVIAEKVQTLLSKFPVIGHRLKDLLDVVALADTHTFDGATLSASLQATLARRDTRADTRVLDDMQEIIADRRWQTSWATMLKEKAVEARTGMREVTVRFDVFVRPILDALADDAQPPTHWKPGGPWT